MTNQSTFIPDEVLTVLIENLINEADPKNKLEPYQYDYIMNQLKEASSKYVTVDDQGKTVFMDLTNRDIVSVNTVMHLINNVNVSIPSSTKRSIEQGLIRSNIFQHVVGTVFRPEHRDYLINDKGTIRFNTYTPPQIKPVEGDVNPFLTYIDCLTKNEGDAAKEHLLDWLAHLIQKPHERTLHGIYLYGDEKGNGKSTLSKVIASLLGSKHVENTNTKIVLGNFDDYRKDKLIVQIDDVDAGNTALDVELKSLSTLDRCTLNIKGGKQLNDYPNLVRFIVTTNEPVGMKMEEGDRRWFCLEVKYQLGNKDNHLNNRAMLFNDLNDMLNSDGGIEALYHYLSTRDVSNFEPMSPAPMTNFKKKLQGNTLLDEGGDFADSINKETVYTNKQVIDLWKKHGNGSASKRVTTMQKLGFTKLEARYLLPTSSSQDKGVLWIPSGYAKQFQALTVEERGHILSHGVSGLSDTDDKRQALYDGALEMSEQNQLLDIQTELEDTTEY